MIKKIINRAILVGFVLLAVATLILWRYSVRVTHERDRYRQNTEALLTDMRRI